MHLKQLFAATLLSFILACQPGESPASLPPDQWIVVGNDRGLRNEFVDMANIVELTGENLRVRSAIIPNMELNFPVRDSLVMGSDTEHWRLLRRNQDTLMLYDSVKNNHYYLQRLNVVSLDSSWLDYPTEHLFQRAGWPGNDVFVFEDRGEQDQGCYVHHVRDRVGSQRIWRSREDGYWRTDGRFNQPIIAYTTGSNQDNVVLVDSIRPGVGIYGSNVNNNIMQWFEQGLLLGEKYSPSLADDYEGTLARLDFAKTQAVLLGDSLKTRYARFSFNGSLPENITALTESDLDELWLLLDGAGYALKAGEKNLRVGSFYFHPMAGFVVVDGGCLNVQYWPVERRDDHLRIRVPVNLLLPKVRPRNVTDDYNFNGVAYFPSEVEMVIPLLPHENSLTLEE